MLDATQCERGCQDACYSIHSCGLLAAQLLHLERHAAASPYSGSLRQLMTANGMRTSATGTTNAAVTVHVAQVPEPQFSPHHDARSRLRSPRLRSPRTTSPLHAYGGHPNEWLHGSRSLHGQNPTVASRAPASCWLGRRRSCCCTCGWGICARCDGILNIPNIPNYPG